MQSLTATLVYSQHQNPKATERSLRPRQRGRLPVVVAPDIEPAPGWIDIWTGYELHLLSLGRSSSTVRNRHSAVIPLARHATAEGLDPSSITREWMQRYLIEQRKSRKGNGYATLFEDLKQFWAWYADERGTASPMKGIGRPRLVETKVPVLSREQLNTVMAACSSRTLLASRDRALLMLMVDSGLRRTEVTQLDVEDVDLKRRTIVVRHGKGDRPRVTTMGDTAAQALWRYLSARGGVKEGPLFTGRTGRRLTPSGLSQAVSAIGRRAGVAGLRPHLFRHAWAHFSKAAGMQEGDLMQLGGWTNTAMLARYGRSLAQERAIDAGRLHAVSSTLGKGAGK
jgi:integrase/recombinase XerC